MTRHMRLKRTLRNPARLARHLAKPTAFERDARRRRNDEPSYRLSPEESRAWLGAVWGVSAAMAYRRRQPGHQ
jgi:hypothetical protein